MSHHIDNFTKLFWLYKQRKSKEGLIPIYLRITVNGKRAEIATKISVLESDWNSKKQLVKPTNFNHLPFNNYLQQLSGRIQDVYNNLLSEGKSISAQILKEQVIGSQSKVDTKTITDVFEYHNLKMSQQVEAGLIVAKTFQRYQITLDKVVKFMKLTYKISDMPLLEVKMRFVTEFEHYLLTVDELQLNTAHKYIKNLKKIMNLAVALDWIPSNPFNNFRCSYTAPSREVLTQEEIDAIRFKDFGIDRLNEVRDVFIFCCYTGFAYSDVYELTPDNVLKGVDGKLWLTIQRRKTGTKESVPMLPIPFELIEKFKTHKYCRKYGKLLPVNSNQNYNAYLKEIAVICKINKRLTSHIARHTFATTITLANGVPIETVSSMLGHNSIKTTQIYAKVLEQKVSEDMKRLHDKLFGTIKNHRTREG